MPYHINQRCTNCGACLPECPTGSILEGKTHHVIDRDTCAEHAACVAVCPVDAITLITEELRKEDFLTLMAGSAKKEA